MLLEKKRRFGKFLPDLKGTESRLRGFLGVLCGKETHVESGEILEVWIDE